LKGENKKEKGRWRKDKRENGSWEGRTNTVNKSVGLPGKEKYHFQIWSGRGKRKGKIRKKESGKINGNGFKLY
jgi:hypothetical protein